MDLPGVHQPVASICPVERRMNENEEIERGGLKGETKASTVSNSSRRAQLKEVKEELKVKIGGN